MSIKGYPTQEKDDRLKAQFATVEPVREKQFGLTVAANLFSQVIGSDLAEAGSSTSEIVATGHAAIAGDTISFTSGVHQTKEVKVASVATNVITLAETLDAAVGTGDGFDILRCKVPVVDSAGSLPITIVPDAIKFYSDATLTDVFEDTVTPGNSAPLPVKLMGVSGPINITAGDLNVQLTDQGATPDAVRIGDGTNRLGITASNEAQVIVTSALPAGTNNIGDVDVVSSALPTGAATSAIQTDGTQKTQLVDGAGDVADVMLLGAAVTTSEKGLIVQSIIHGESTAAPGTYVNIKSNPSGSLTVESTIAGIDATVLGQDTMANSLPVVIASDQSAIPASQSGTWNINNVSGTVSLPTGAATETTLASIDGKLNSLGQKAMAASAPVVLASDQSAIPVTDNGGSLTVDGTVAATQSGTWNITNISGTVSLPTGAATETTLDAIKTAVELIDNAVSGSELQVDVVAALPTGTNTIGAVNVNTLSVVDLLDTPAWDTSSANIAGSASNPTEVVASLAADVKKMQILDTTGAFIGVYTGAALSEVLRLVVGPGSDQTIEHTIASGTRVSLRRLDSTTAISSGIVSINFLG